MQGLTAELLKGCWYLAMPAAQLKVGQMVAKTICGEPMLFARHKDGSVFALRDSCPHRGIPLRHGSFEGNTVQCCYHGWRFDQTGTCTEIPSMREDQQVDLAKIRCGNYPAQDQQGIVWVFVPRDGEQPANARLPAPPPWLVARTR